ncbi:MAG: DNA polymerase III subunit chi [Pontixanthobacter sp.]
MKVDFWQLSRDPVETVVALIAHKARTNGDRLLVVSAHGDQRDKIGEALWSHQPEAFLANGNADAPNADRQPILVSAECTAANNADVVIFADGEWRDHATKFARSFLLFSDEAVENARACWRSLDGSEGLERSFYRQDRGKWTKVA